MNEKYKTSLKEKGWAEDKFDSIENLKEKLYQLSQSFGTPKSSRKSISAIQEIKPTRSSSARPNTLSKIYSDKAFPLHVDTAHWCLPSRFCIMTCLNPGSENRETVLLDFKKVALSTAERNLLKNALFRVVNGKESFFSTILSDDRSFIRYDTGCMIPLNEDSKRAVELMNFIQKNNNLIELNWDIGKILIMDNWRILNGRNTAINSDNDRTLLRVLTI